ncbi:hypothetical protein V5O48_011041 [Marasmius crinis-equi]|uniref:Uncharacterized protein n=1 Tax=Marasmius crinis-equi TaxID=585013 RepID=A0ABR3F6P6_9AGAR
MAKAGLEGGISIEMLERILTLTKQQPLRVSLKIVSLDFRPSNRFLDLIRPSFHRWIFLRYDIAQIPETGLIASMAPIVWSLFPFLKEVASRTSSLLQVVMHARECPSLPHSAISELPWSQLAYLEVIGYRDPALGFLSQCNSLNTLVFGPGTYSRSAYQHVAWNLPNIKILKVTSSYDNAHLSQLTLPGLVDIELFCTDDTILQFVVDLVKRSSCRLAIITLHNLAFLDEEVERFLRKVGSSVIELTLEGQIPVVVFDSLADPTDSFLPKLESLTILHSVPPKSYFNSVLDDNGCSPEQQYPSELSPPLSPLLKAAKARCGALEGISTLKKLEIEVYRNAPLFALVEEIQKLQDSKTLVRVRVLDDIAHEGPTMVRLGLYLQKRFGALLSLKSRDDLNSQKLTKNVAVVKYLLRFLDVYTSGENFDPDTLTEVPSLNPTITSYAYRCYPGSQEHDVQQTARVIWKRINRMPISGK